MKTRTNLIVLFVLLGGILLSACGAAAHQAADTRSPAATQAPAMENMAGAAPQPMGAVPAEGAADSASVQKQEPAVSSSNLPVGPVYDTGATSDNTSANYAASHMIIKNAEIKLLVEDTDVAIDRTTQIAGDVTGYIISSRVWYQQYHDGKSYKYATLTLGVPVDQFERTLNRLRGLAVQVEDETASGDDVTNQYVDLQSQLTNLEATRDRIKSFLDQATTVDEALRINQELSNVEAQIEQIKGQMKYLQDRSAFSTITVNFEPQLPDLVSTPTPTPTPSVWNPGETFKHAQKTVTSAYQGIIDFLIWFFIVLVPILAPPALIIWGIWKLLTRKSNKPSG